LKSAASPSKTARRSAATSRSSSWRADFDAVFLGVGLPGVNALGVDGDDAAGASTRSISSACCARPKIFHSSRDRPRVVVIGGGMTAIDAAMQAKLLGAEEVTVTYRRGQEHMNASLYEQELAQTNGIAIRHWLMPKSLEVSGGAVAAITLEKTALDASGKLAGTGETVTIQADQVFKAIGQTPDAGPWRAFRSPSRKAASASMKTGEHRIRRSGPAATASPPAKISPWSPSKTARSPLKAFTKP
jgi:NADPH-dependent glutamate synthase beta subunit-like oxidoreductase